VTPKLPAVSAHERMMCETVGSLTCEKLQRMWPLKRIGEEEVVQNE